MSRFLQDCAEFIRTQPFDIIRITRIKDVDLTHHLTHDDFEVFIVNLNALHTVNVLNFVNDIFLNSSRTLDVKDVAWSHSTIRKRSTGTNVVVFLHKDLL